jgi:hypothetical protein
VQPIDLYWGDPICPKISIGQLCGFLLLFVLLTSVLSKLMAGDRLDPEDAPNTLGVVAQTSKRFRMSIVLDLASHVSVVALSGALYLAFSPHNRSLALLGTPWRVTQGVIIACSEVNNVVLLAAAQRFVSATGAEAIALGTLGRAFIVAEDWGLKAGLADVRHSVRFERSRATCPGLVCGCCRHLGRRRKVVGSGRPRCGVGCDQLCAYDAL